MRPPERGNGRAWLVGVACLLIGAGAVTIFGGPPLRVSADQSAFAAEVMAPELAAHRDVSRVTRELPTHISGARFIVGDSQAWYWATEPRVYAHKGATSADVRRALVQVPRTGPVDELIVWLGSDEIRTGRTPGTLLADVAAIIAYVQPTEYVVVAPLPRWTSDESIAIEKQTTQALMGRFPGRVADPYGVLQAALFVRAPVYYDDYHLTSVGYDQVRNQVEITLGYNQKPLSLGHGILEYGRMTAPLPVGLRNAKQRGPW